MSFRAVLAPSLLAVAALGAVPASATCAGSTRAHVCVHPENAEVDPDGGHGFFVCIHVGDGGCYSAIVVPTPSVTTTGPLYGVWCGFCP